MIFHQFLKLDLVCFMVFSHFLHFFQFSSEHTWQGQTLSSRRGEGKAAASNSCKPSWSEKLESCRELFWSDSRHWRDIKLAATLHQPAKFHTRTTFAPWGTHLRLVTEDLAVVNFRRNLELMPLCLLTVVQNSSSEWIFRTFHPSFTRCFGDAAG